MGWNPVKEAEKAAKKVVDKVVNPAANSAKNLVNRAGDEAKSGVRKVGREIEGGVKKVGHEVEGGIKKAGHEIEDGLQKTGREIEEGITKKLPELAEEGIKEVIAAATSDSVQKGLNMALDMIELCSPNSFSLYVGVELALVIQVEFKVVVDIPNPMSKLTEIRKWAENPPEGRSEIIACVKDFAPSSLTVKAGVSGNGGSASFDGGDKFDRLDAFLAKQGV